MSLGKAEGLQDAADGRPARRRRWPSLPLPALRPPLEAGPKAEACQAAVVCGAARGDRGQPPWPSEAPEPSARAAALRQEVHLLLRPTAHATAAVNAVTKLVLEACLRWRLSLPDLEALVLPHWGLEWSFPDRASFAAYVDPWPEFWPGEPVRLWSGARQAWLHASVTGKRPVWKGPLQQMSMLYDLDVEPGVEPRRRTLLSADLVMGECCNCEFTGPHGFTCHSVRWVELLDGRILARLMTDPCPTLLGERDESFRAAVLEGLRGVPWAPELHWVFPARWKARLTFLSWVGGVLGLNPTWSLEVLPFLGCDLASPPGGSAR